MSATLHPVPSGLLDHYWPIIEGDIEAATARSNGRLDKGVIFDALTERAMQLWFAVDGRIKALAVTELKTYKTGLKVCSILIVTGEDRDLWMRLIEGIKDWARQNGCKRIEAWARPGWAKVLGWKETHRLIEEGL